MADGVSSFLLHIGPELLDEYAKKRGLTFVASTKKEEVEENAERFLKIVDDLPDDQRDEIFAELQMITEMVGTRGFDYLLDGAKRNGMKVDEAEIEGMRNYSERALWFHLQDSDFFLGVSEIYDLDYMTGWRRVPVNKVDKTDAVSRIKALEEALRLMYREEFRGKRLIVKHIDLGDRLCFIAYIEDLPTSEIELQSAGVKRGKPRRPVIEAHFIYRPDEGLLEVKAGGGKLKVFRLQKAFAESVLEYELIAENAKTFDFEKLKDFGSLKFDTELEDGVDSVCLKGLRLFYPDRKKKITLEVDDPFSTGCDAMAKMVRDLNVPIGSLFVQQAVIQIKFKPTGKGRRKSVTVRVTFPSSHDLRGRKEDKIVRRLLKDWGIDALHE